MCDEHFSIVVVEYINKFETTIGFILTSTKYSNSMETHKRGKKEKLSINNFPLFTFKLVI